MARPPRKPGRWRRRSFILLLLIILPLWGRGVWEEHKVETEGQEITGRVVGGDWKGRDRPHFIVEFPTRNGVHQKEFGVTDREVERVTGGTEAFVHPEIRVRYHEDFPDRARLADTTTLPWWAGLIGMTLALSLLGFMMWLPPDRQ
jgi:hypothetical protein